jgi:hypothetical protein
MHLPACRALRSQEVANAVRRPLARTKANYPAKGVVVGKAQW